MSIRTNPRAARPRMSPAALAIAIALASPIGVGAIAQTRDATVPRAPVDLAPVTIRTLQHSLIQGGYGVRAADGVWGPDTADALREFQRVKGLPATGRPDARTLAALGVGTAPDGTPRAALTPPAVRARTPADLDRTTIRAIQQALAAQGLRTGSADGVWGERTHAAIASLQRARGMPASGELDAHTLAALGLLPAGTQRPQPRADGQPLTASSLDPAAIRLIQQALRGRGAEVDVDGQWGERTANGLRTFQRTQGLEPLGEPDVYTLAALGLLPGGPRPLMSTR